MLDQRVIIDLPRHTRTLLPHHNAAVTRDFTLVCGC
jgi:hypothetical protein